MKSHITPEDFRTPCFTSLAEKQEYMAAILAGEIPCAMEQKGMGIDFSNIHLVNASMDERLIAFLSAALPGHEEVTRQLEEARSGGKRLGIKGQKALSLREDEKAMAKNIAAVREKHPLGILGVNAMKAINEYRAMVQVCGESGQVDFLDQSAGIDHDLAQLIAMYPNMIISPVVSSARAARIMLTQARKKGQVIRKFYYEDPRKAAGHLGVTKMQDAISPQEGQKPVDDVRPEVVIQEIRKFFDGPVICGGGMMYYEDFEEAIAMGYNGVGLGTRFLLTQESGMSNEILLAKYLDLDGATEVTTKSPTGFSSRWLVNPDMETRIKERPEEIRKRTKHECIACIGGGTDCKFIMNETPYCIAQDLTAARHGKSDGVLFTGSDLPIIRNDAIYRDELGNLRIPTVSEMVSFVLNPANKRPGRVAA